MITREPPVARTWYIPQHGVYHPNKSVKICVVFDCSAEFKGTLPKKNLLSGPDLINQIVGVVMKFCPEPVVIMGDIEAMFQQVLVPENDHDISGKEADSEMSIPVFGSTSSPSCCNYALKQTACNNETKYLPDDADSFM